MGMDHTVWLAKLTSTGALHTMQKQGKRSGNVSGPGHWVQRTWERLRGSPLSSSSAPLDACAAALTVGRSFGHTRRRIFGER